MMFEISPSFGELNGLAERDGGQRAHVGEAAAQRAGPGVTQGKLYR